MIRGRIKLVIPHTTKRYLDVFSKAGFTGWIVSNALIRFKPEKLNISEKAIGIAPLARHSTKTWNTDHVRTVINTLLTNHSCKIYLFGGFSDQSELGRLASDRVINTAGLFNPLEELALISSLDLFISMDSANMHLASLAGVPTLSVWGATDPALGFSALNQPAHYSFFADPSKVTCRPCSVYGERPCHRKDYPMECMDKVYPQPVVKVAEEILDRGR